MTEEALKTGQPQNEAKSGGGRGWFEIFLYADPARLRQFLAGMTGISISASAVAIAQKFPVEELQDLCGMSAGAAGAVPVQVALAHKHLKGVNFDLPPVGPIFTDYVKSFGLSDRLSFQGGDFFKEALPKVDVIVMEPHPPRLVAGREEDNRAEGIRRTAARRSVHRLRGDHPMS